MVELPNDEDFAPRLSFSVERSLLAYLEPDDYVLTVHGSICTDDDTEIGRLLGYIIQVPFLAQGLTSSVFSYMEELQRPVHAGVRKRWNKDHSAATPQPTERREFTTETLSTQSSECSLIKNSCLCALRASAVSPYYGIDSMTSESDARKLAQAAQNFIYSSTEK